MPLPDSGGAERAAWLRLVLTPGIGIARIRRLQALFCPPSDTTDALGLPDPLPPLPILAVRDAPLRRLTLALGATAAAHFLAPDPQREAAVEACLAWAREPDHHLLALDDADYPSRLAHIADPPPLLFVHGPPALLQAPAVAVVGSRNPTRTGLAMAEEFAQALSERGLTVASGLARGIDAAAHRGALQGCGNTFAVLGTGIDVIYPAEHRGLAGSILAGGGVLVSEQPPGTPARPKLFPMRNRILAGLTQGVLVIEAARHSGSLITARLALDYGREVMAVPGSIHAPLARGCHHLIRQGARLVESIQDVLEELRLSVAGTTADEIPFRPGQAASLHAAHRATLKVLGWHPASLDRLLEDPAIRAAGLDSGTLGAVLLDLELEGRVEQLADGRYVQRPEKSRKLSSADTPA